MSQKINDRAEAFAKIATLKQQLLDLQKAITDGEYDQEEKSLAFGHIAGKIDSIIKNNFSTIETHLRLKERERSKKQYLKSDGTPLLTIDIYNDLKARLTVNEISKKYKISVVSFYNHLKASSLEELDVKKLQKDERYSAVKLSKISDDEVF